MITKAASISIAAADSVSLVDALASVVIIGLCLFFVLSVELCLCLFLASSGGASLSIAINQTLALTLPAACNVQTPTISQCNVHQWVLQHLLQWILTPPADSSNGTPQTPITPSQSNTPSARVDSKTAPSTTGALSGGSSIKSSSPLQIADLQCSFSSSSHDRAQIFAIFIGLGISALRYFYSITS
ncbi:hypothetical protein LOK49_LG15G00496 [Camellia lanceoleosa]|uniref:Uncharacterized protein n=1 Tax=Camellia lanceoleosa TaxID=1840588 RepID=A0ACC0F2D1_9ERIC|nr:hypothetical protein LOK49_LG15G00496 [Camellia lanceoleosa]